MFDSLLTGLLAGLLGPLMYLFLSLSLASAAIGNKLLGRLRDFFKTLITWALKLVLSLFTGYMAITGVISGTAGCSGGEGDQNGHLRCGTGGGGDALQRHRDGAGRRRCRAQHGGSPGTAGDFSHYGCAFLKLGFQYLLLKLTAALCGVVGSENHTALTESFAQAMGLHLATTGTCCLIQLISTVCFMKGVI